MAIKKDFKESEEKLSKKKNIKAQINNEENKVVKFQEFVENNRKSIVYVSIGLITITVLFFIIRGFLDKRNEENTKVAAVSLDRILQYYNKGDFQKSLNGDPAVVVRGQKVIGLLDIVKEYSGTEQAKIAALYAGNCLLGQQNGKEAEKYFDKALNSDSKLIQMGANAGYGASKEFEGDYKEAINYYNKASELAETDQDSRFRYMYFGGLCYEKIGDKKSAEEKYRQILEETIYSEYANYAKTGLTRLGTIIE